MSIAIKPWPKRLMDVERGARCRTKREVATGFAVIRVMDYLAWYLALRPTRPAPEVVGWAERVGTLRQMIAERREFAAMTSTQPA